MRARRACGRRGRRTESCRACSAISTVSISRREHRGSERTRARVGRARVRASWRRKQLLHALSLALSSRYTIKRHTWARLHQGAAQKSVTLPPYAQSPSRGYENEGQPECPKPSEPALDESALAPDREERQADAPWTNGSLFGPPLSPVFGFSSPSNSGLGLLTKSGCISSPSLSPLRSTPAAAGV